MSIVSVHLSLNRQHYKRLRWYFGHTNGGASATDNIDLHLCAIGLVERIERNSLVQFKITQAGTVELFAENQREIERRKPHHSLAGSLAEWLRGQGRVTWENTEFLVDRESFGQIAKQAVRPDVFSIKATLNPDAIRPRVHEVKVSRADFLADVAKPEKRALYSLIAEDVYYVAPAGMVCIEECPPECGLLLASGNGFDLIKKPSKKRQRVELQPRQFVNMILKPGSLNPASWAKASN
jgi:hypothetical protein